METPMPTLLFCLKDETPVYRDPSDPTRAFYHRNGYRVGIPADQDEFDRIIAIILMPSQSRIDAAIEALINAPTAQSLPKTAAQEVAPIAEGTIGAGRQ